jgi:DNA-binding NarL/FixJ family response regulator
VSQQSRRVRIDLDELALSNVTPPPDSHAGLAITQRRLEILTWVGEGKSATDIGEILGISHRTVEHHVEKVCNTLGVRTRVQAVLKVRDLGLFEQAGS